MDFKLEAEAAKKQIEDGEYTLIVLSKNGECQRFNGRGVRDLFFVYDNAAESLKGSCIFDRIIGRAAAVLAVLGDAKYVYGKVMSRAAIELLKDANITAECGQKTEYILNRTGDGCCPIEQAALSKEDCEGSLKAIRHRMAELAALAHTQKQ